MRQHIQVILDCQLFEMLQGYNPDSVTHKDFETAFEEVHSLLQEVTDGDESFCEKFRILTVITAFVNGIKARSNDVKAHRTIKMLKECLRAELELLQKHGPMLWKDIEFCSDGGTFAT